MASRDAESGLSDLVVFAGVKYFTQSLIAPLQVAKVLQQVQYLPSDDFLRRTQLQVDELASPDELEDNVSSVTDGNSSAAGGSETSEQDAAESIFHQATTPAVYMSTSTTLSHITDDQGYLVQTSFAENDPVRPTYQLAPQDGSLYETAVELAGHPTEGLLSLWKGQLAHFLHEMLYLLVQPTLEGLLNDMLSLPDESIPLVHLDNPAPNVATLVFSSVVTGLLLSPLDLVRTRMILQPARPRHRKYHHPIHALRTIWREEGTCTFLSPPLLLSTALHRFATSVFHHLPDLAIERGLGATEEDHPVTYSVLVLVWNSVELLVTLPLETVRRRLQCQVNLAAGVTQEVEYVTVVETRRMRYTGVLDCASSIVDEEGGRRSGRRRRSLASGAVKVEPEYGRSWYDGWGTKRLFVGLRPLFWVNVGMFGVTAVSHLGGELE